MATYVIADLHGRHDLFVNALSVIRDHSAGRGGRLIVLGDFVDRGPQSREIIEHLMAPMPPGWSLTVLQGNHEDIMLQAIVDPGNCLRWWIGNGGGATLQSYGYRDGDHIRPNKVPVEHLEWLANLPVWIEDEHRIYVHAGVEHETEVADTSRQTLQWGLYTNEFRDSTQLVDLPHRSGKHVVHGHHQSASHPLKLAHRTNLDAFAWHEGRLAIGVFDDILPGGPVDVLWATPFLPKEATTPPGLGSAAAISTGGDDQHSGDIAR